MGNTDKSTDSKSQSDKPGIGSSDIASPSASVPLSEEAQQLQKEQKQRILDSQMRTEYPTLNALAARSVYYGVQGRLFPSMSQVAQTMSQSGPVGEAALSRMGALADKGWKFGALSMQDEFIANQSKSFMGRLAKVITLGGYNDAQSGKIAHNAISSLTNTIIGVSDGADKDIANKYIHELAHGKYAAGYKLYEATPAARDAFRALPIEGQTLHGQQMVQEELRALVAQVAGNAHQQGEFRAFLTPQTRGLSNYLTETAIKSDQVGTLVKNVWGYEGSRALSTEQANKAASEYMKSNYGDLFKNGRLNPQAETAIAAEIARLPVQAPLTGGTIPELAGAIPSVSAATAETAFSSSRYYNYVSRGGQALGSLAALSAMADLRNQFMISTGSGMGRIASVGTDWAGFETGAAVGGWFGEGVTQMLVKSNPRVAMLALPLISMGSGLIASQMMHNTVSKPLELKTTKAIDEMLSPRKQ